ncbi:MAG: hypothetical protein ACRCYS_02115 [Beijerinckiaceae bacterium]
MTRPAKPFATVRTDLALEQARCQQILTRAAPPEAMSAAPIAPARGTMHLQANYEATRGGLRRVDGAHWETACRLRIMNAQAATRHASRTPDAPFAPPFTEGQIAIASLYRTLSMARDAGGVKCSSLEAGRGGSGSGVFIDRFIDQGARLKALWSAIGIGLALSPRSHMDRDNARRPLTCRQLVDRVILLDQDLTEVSRAAGWAKKTETLAALRDALKACLDRMQGYPDPRATK